MTSMCENLSMYLYILIQRLDALRKGLREVLELEMIQAQPRLFAAENSTS